MAAGVWAAAAGTLAAGEGSRASERVGVICDSAPGVHPEQLAALCHAVRAQAEPDSFRLHLRQAGRAFLSATLHPLGDNPAAATVQLDLSVMDRNLEPADYDRLAQDLLQVARSGRKE
ncbi:MAG: hypothetical protein FJX25_19475 [Alphaproteobacteria bacterium]|nr:hypothetical protein [Alphaproteobacteria bacterium]